MALRPVNLLCAATIAAALSSPGAGSADQGLGSSSAAGHLDFRIDVPPIVRVKALTAPDRLAVGAADRAVGHVDAVGSFVVSSNSGAGYAVSVDYDPRVLSGAVIEIQGQRIEAWRPGTSVQVVAPKMRDVRIEVRYRLYLPPSTRQGIYRWPLRLQFTAGA